MSFPIASRDEPSLPHPNRSLPKGECVATPLVKKIDDVPPIPQFVSIFDDMQASVYPYSYDGTLNIKTLLGGVPSDQRVIDGWLRTKIGLSKEDDLKAQVAMIVAERGISKEAAAEELARNRSLNGFLRERCRQCPPIQGSEEVSPLCGTGKHQLKIAGRQLKAGLKEAANIAVASGVLPSRGWGTTNKGLLGFFAEHFFVLEDDLLLEDAHGQPVYEPTGVLQNFVHSRFGSAIQYQEYVTNCQFQFTVIADYPLTRKEFGAVWITGQMQGIGSSRSQGYGRYVLSRWDDNTPPEVLARGKPKALRVASNTSQ